VTVFASVIMLNNQQHTDIIDLGLNSEASKLLKETYCIWIIHSPKGLLGTPY